MDGIKPVTLPALLARKGVGPRIACLTAYDAAFARVLDESGVDVILVGDSLAMVMQGKENTLSATVDDMVYHSRCVTAATRRAFVIADMPFMSYATPEQAARNAGRLIGEGGARMVKLEGGRQKAEIVRFLVEQNVPVCGHLGLMPQSIHRLGRYEVQGREDSAAAALVEDACILEDAGASMIVLECVPAALARQVTEAIAIPTIGIGAGLHCDGQVLVLHDMLGMGRKTYRFCKDFLQEGGDIRGAVRAYVAAVRERRFPGPEHAF
jgi:3-methyl-2-oxobutanoate hydroxymethyltransferase